MRSHGDSHVDKGKSKCIIQARLTGETETHFIFGVFIRSTRSRLSDLYFADKNGISGSQDCTFWPSPLVAFLKISPSCRMPRNRIQIKQRVKQRRQL